MFKFPNLPGQFRQAPLVFANRLQHILGAYIVELLDEGRKLHVRGREKQLLGRQWWTLTLIFLTCRLVAPFFGEQVEEVLSDRIRGKACRVVVGVFLDDRVRQEEVRDVSQPRGLNPVLPKTPRNQV